MGHKNLSHAGARGRGEKRSKISRKAAKILAAPSPLRVSASPREIFSLDKTNHMGCKAHHFLAMRLYGKAKIGR
jgi:hypothetical protein